LLQGRHIARTNPLRHWDIYAQVRQVNVLLRILPQGLSHVMILLLVNVNVAYLLRIQEVSLSGFLSCLPPLTNITLALKSIS